MSKVSVQGVKSCPSFVNESVCHAAQSIGSVVYTQMADRKHEYANVTNLQRHLGNCRVIPHSALTYYCFTNAICLQTEARIHEMDVHLTELINQALRLGCFSIYAESCWWQLPVYCMPVPCVGRRNSGIREREIRMFASVCPNLQINLLCMQARGEASGS